MKTEEEVKDAIQFCKNEIKGAQKSIEGLLRFSDSDTEEDIEMQSRKIQRLRVKIAELEWVLNE